MPTSNALLSRDDSAEDEAVGRRGDDISADPLRNPSDERWSASRGITFSSKSQDQTWQPSRGVTFSPPPQTHSRSVSTKSSSASGASTRESPPTCTPPMSRSSPRKSRVMPTSLSEREIERLAQLPKPLLTKHSGARESPNLVTHDTARPLELEDLHTYGVILASIHNVELGYLRELREMSRRSPTTASLLLRPRVLEDIQDDLIRRFHDIKGLVHAVRLLFWRKVELHQIQMQPGTARAQFLLQKLRMQRLFEPFFEFQLSQGLLWEYFRDYNDLFCRREGIRFLNQPLRGIGGCRQDPRRVHTLKDLLSKCCRRWLEIEELRNRLRTSLVQDSRIEQVMYFQKSFSAIRFALGHVQYARRRATYSRAQNQRLTEAILPVLRHWRLHLLPALLDYSSRPANPSLIPPTANESSGWSVEHCLLSELSREIPEAGPIGAEGDVDVGRIPEIVTPQGIEATTAQSRQTSEQTTRGETTTSDFWNRASSGLLSQSSHGASQGRNASRDIPSRTADPLPSRPSKSTTRGPEPASFQTNQAKEGTATARDLWSRATNGLAFSQSKSLKKGASSTSPTIHTKSLPLNPPESTAKDFKFPLVLEEPVAPIEESDSFTGQRFEVNESGYGDLRPEHAKSAADLYFRRFAVERSKVTISSEEIMIAIFGLQKLVEEQNKRGRKTALLSIDVQDMSDEWHNSKDALRSSMHRYRAALRDSCDISAMVTRMSLAERLQSIRFRAHIRLRKLRGLFYDLECSKREFFCAFNELTKFRRRRGLPWRGMTPRPGIPRFTPIRSLKVLREPFTELKELIDMQKVKRNDTKFDSLITDVKRSLAAVDTALRTWEELSPSHKSFAFRSLGMTRRWRRNVKPLQSVLFQASSQSSMEFFSLPEDYGYTQDPSHSDSLDTKRMKPSAPVDNDRRMNTSLGLLDKARHRSSMLRSARSDIALSQRSMLEQHKDAKMENKKGTLHLHPSKRRRLSFSTLQSRAFHCDAAPSFASDVDQPPPTSSLNNTVGSIACSPLGFRMPDSVFEVAFPAGQDQEPKYWDYALYRSPLGEKVKVHYCKTKADTERIARLFFDEEVIGFDIEWVPNVPAKEGIKKNVSLIQIASETRIALFHLSRFWGEEDAESFVAPTFRYIMQSPRITKVGVSIKADCTRLRRFLGIESQGLFELSHLYKLVKYSQGDAACVDKRLVKLATQVEEHLGLPLWKGQDVRAGDWSAELNYQQVQYAASDSYAGFQLYHALEQKRLTLDPTPPRPYHAELNLPIRLSSGRSIETDDEDSDIDDDPPTSTDPSIPPTVEELARDFLRLQLKAPKLPLSKPPKPASSTPKSVTPEYTLAQDWVTSWKSTLPGNYKTSASPASLRAYALWHEQGKNIPEAAALLRDPPLQNGTVAVYVLEALRLEKLPSEKEPLAALLDHVPPAGRPRYRRFVKEKGLEFDP